MINAKIANDNMISHMNRKPLKQLKTLEEIIRVSSMIGNESVSVWIDINKVDNWRKKLRELGYSIRIYIPASLPKEALMEIHWNVSEFNKFNEEKMINE